MEKKKNSHITEIVVSVIIIICLGLIVLELSSNISNNLDGIERRSVISE